MARRMMAGLVHTEGSYVRTMDFTYSTDVRVIPHAGYPPLASRCS